jgi:hypothetical protein
MMQKNHSRKTIGVACQKKHCARTPVIVRSGLREKILQGAPQDAHTFFNDDGGRGVARGDAGSGAGRDLAAQSGDGELQYCGQLDACDGAEPAPRSSAQPTSQT